MTYKGARMYSKGRRASTPILTTSFWGGAEGGVGIRTATNAAEQRRGEETNPSFTTKTDNSAIGVKHVNNPEGGGEMWREGRMKRERATQQ